MKLIHCADIHLGSSLTTHFDAEEAKIRNAELFHTFSDLFSYASTRGVSGILIAGDLFDRSVGIASIKANVISLISSFPQIQVYYLHGNHDDISDGTVWPENVHLFTDDNWTNYTLSPLVTLSGREIGHSPLQYEQLHLDEKKINFVMLHGQVVSYREEQDGNKISLPILQEYPIDYLALGHLHAYRKEGLNYRGVYCYSGCLEGRGYDETGEHGFVEIDIDEQNRKVTSAFVPFARHQLFDERIDVSGFEFSYEIAEYVKEVIFEKNMGRDDYARITLFGETALGTEVDAQFIQEQSAGLLKDLYVVDNTVTVVDYRQFELDESLKGEFVRQVEADPELDEETRAKVIKAGMAALSGKDLSV